MYNGEEYIPCPGKEVLMYSYETKRWKYLAPMRVARMQHALCIEDGLIYAIGGIGEGNRWVICNLISIHVSGNLICFVHFY